MTAPLIQAAEVALGRQRAPQYETGEHIILYLRSANIGDGHLDLNDVKSMNFTPAEQTTFSLRAGDVLVTEGSGSRDTVGTSGVWRNELPPPVCFQNTVLRLRPRPGISDGRYIAWWMRHAHASGLIAAVATGANILHLGAENLRRLPIDLPRLADQQQIADFLDDQVSRIDQLEVLRRHQLELLSQRRRETIRVGVAGALHGQGVQTEVPWVPVLGPEAELRPLARMVTLQRGVDLTADEREHGEYAVVTSGGPSGFHSRAVVPHSGVVIGRYGSGGSVFWAEGPHWPHNTTLYVRDYKSNHLRWVFYLMQAYPYDALQARTAVPGVNRNDMARDLMPWLPPKRQVQAVAAIDKALASIDTLAQQLSRSVTLLNERKRALITAAVTGEFDVTTAMGRGVE